MRRLALIALTATLALPIQAQDASTVMVQVEGSEAALRIVSGLTIDTPASERSRWPSTWHAAARWADTFAPIYRKARIAAADDARLQDALDAHQAKARQCVELLDWSPGQTAASLRQDSLHCQQELVEKRALVEIALDHQR